MSCITTNSNGSRAASARGFMALFAMLAMGLGLMARPAEAAPFAYVANVGRQHRLGDRHGHQHRPWWPRSRWGLAPSGAAVAPDGKHVYVTNGLGSSGSAWVIDTSMNTVVATIQLGGYHPSGVAVTPDGKHVYVTIYANGQSAVSVIDTTINAVVATIQVGLGANGVAVTPDGRHVYVAL